MTSNMKLAISIINYLREESKRDIFTPDTKESLEVAVQCLQTAYDIDSSDIRITQNDSALSLETIFNSATLSEEIDENLTGDLKKAAMMKNIGNNLMKSNQFSKAVKYYTAAIDLDNQNAIYYGNRAAAYSKLNEFKNAVTDCEKAIEIDPKYAKAYGRMGLAYTSLDQPDKAVEAFKKAVEIDPDNESYQSNLKLAIEKTTKTMPNMPVPPMANINWGNILGNPIFRNMASTLMQDPSIMTAIEAGLSSYNQGAPPPSFSGSDDSAASGSNSTGGNNRSIDMLLEAGQLLAAQLNAEHPGLLDQIRREGNPFNPNPDNKDPQ